MRRLLCLAALSVVIVLVLGPTALAQTESLNCEHFANQEAAQAILNEHGDLYGHDPDGDGVACEDTGTGTAEDGTLAPFAAYAQYQYSGAAPEELADTGGPSLAIAAVAATLMAGACVVGLFVVARRGLRAANLGVGQHIMVDLGPNAKRLAVVVFAVALAALLAVLVGAGVVGPTKSASAQGNNRLAISTAVYPSPAGAIPNGTKMDFLITERNISNRRVRTVTVMDQLPAGVTYVSANSSQGQCYPMADQPIINCDLGTIRPRGVVHINVIVRATTRGTHSNVVYDNLRNQASAQFTIVRRSGFLSTQYSQY
jgi:uncharacterized repeat protein (TIGR01451 family)